MPSKYAGYLQAVIDAGIIPPLVQLLANAEFDIQKEAAWAISNATSGGSHDQIKYLVYAGCIKPLCDLLDCSEAKIVKVAMEGLENILKVCHSHVACIVDALQASVKARSCKATLLRSN